MNTKTVASIALTVFALLVLVRIFNVSYPVDIRISQTTMMSELSVVGEGSVEVKPDIAYIDAGITVSRARTAAEAKERMSRVNNAVISAVKLLGIKEADITTSNFSIYPEQDYSNTYYPLPVSEPEVGESTAPSMGEIEPRNSRIVGYNGNATISIKVRNTEQASIVVEAVTRAGANNVGSPRFAIEKPEKYREEARKKAIADAQEQAQKLSKELGLKLGKVTNFIESDNNYPMPAYDRAYGGTLMSPEAKSTEPTIEEGTQTVSSTVTLFFERK